MSTDTSDLEVGTRWGAMKNKVRALGFLAVHNVLQKLRPEALKNSVSFRVFAGAIHTSCSASSPAVLNSRAVPPLNILKK